MKIKALRRSNLFHLMSLCKTIDKGLEKIDKTIDKGLEKKKTFQIIGFKLLGFQIIGFLKVQL